MKRIAGYLLISSLFLGMTAFSCTQAPAPEQEPEEQEEQPKEKPVYTFVASPLQGTWKAGDQVYVHGSSGAEAQIITFASADISADGKTACASLSEDAEISPAAPDGLYAAWPAQAVNPYQGITNTRTSFLNSEALLTVAYLEADNTFRFVDASSSLSFTVSGEYDQYALCANSFDALVFTTFNVVYASSGKFTYSRKNNGEPFRKGRIEAGKPVKVWIPGDLTIKGGVTVYVGKNDEWELAGTVEDKISLKMGETKDLGDITAHLKPFTDPGPKGLQLGERVKYKVNFNELSGLCVSLDGDFLWSVGDNGELARISFEGELLDRVTLKWGDPEGDNGGYDTEGITIDPRTGDLLCAEEPNYIGRILFEDQATAFDGEEAFNILNTIFRIDDAKNYDNSGTEGITYYKDGLVYVGAQDGPADLFLCEIETGKVVKKKRLHDYFPSMSEIAGLCYDPLTDWLWVVDSNSPKKFFALSGDASRILAVCLIDGASNPESICVDHKNKCVWVGDDAEPTSIIYKYPFPDIDQYNIANESN